MPNTTSWVRKQKRQKRIAMLTAYDYSMARLLDQAGIDIILVGDSAGMVMQGEKTTLNVTLDEMILYTRSVARGVSQALVVSDMPFLTYQTDPATAIFNAGRLLQAGAQAVKLEGGEAISETVRRLVSCGIPVMGHIGLTPQSLHQFGGYKIQGRDEDQAAALVEAAQALETAGVFSLVVEAVPWKLGKMISESIHVPVIGIGAGPYCDGQVLVMHDLLGMTDTLYPHFVKRYAELGLEIKKACRKFVEDVKKGKFPTLKQSYD